MSATPRRIGKYELQTLLGSGSVGEVWKSYDLQHRCDVAIKIFYTELQSDPNFMNRLLSDFGIARSTNSSARNSILYISPEQAKGLPPTRHSDIYSLGVILYEICTGVPPFRSESPVVLMMQHIHMQPISPTLINNNIPS